MAVRTIAGWTAGAVALGLALPAMAQDGMPSFASDAALRTFLTTEPPPVEAPPPPPPPPPPPISHHDRPIPGRPSLPEPPGPIEHDPPAAWRSAVTPTADGVDAGDLLQPVGDHLVVLRRGRLFSIATVDGALRTVDSADAFAPGSAVLRDWAGQMFAIGDDRIAVVAFSAARGGTEISRFQITSAGAIRWIDTHQLHRGGPYTPTAARMVDGRLIFYVNRDIEREAESDLLAGLPWLRRWSPAGFNEGQRLADAGEVHAPVVLMASGAGGLLSLAAVTRCDVAAVELTCDARATLVSHVRDYHLARDAVYVWSYPGHASLSAPIYVYRIPHHGGVPEALRVDGDPAGVVDSAGFGLSADGAHLQVVIKRPHDGEPGDAPDFALGRLALARLPVARFGDGSAMAAESDYLPLPSVIESQVNGAAVIGGAAVVSHRPWHTSNLPGGLVAVAAGASTPVELDGASDYYRVTPAGRDAVVTGWSGGLPFEVVDLDAPGGPTIGPVYEQSGTGHQQSIDHPFRYRPDLDASDGERGLLAFPVGPSITAMDMVFLRRDGERLSEAGRLTATPGRWRDDGCRASCAAWNRDVRAVFVGDRIFALLRYELVEGELTPNGRLREIRRLDFAPPEPPAPAE